MKQALREELSSATPLIRETAELALRKLDSVAEKERMMLTMIEKVVFLKQVQFFDEVPASDLRAIAGVTETATYEAGQTIITEGEPSDALYVIVSGRVAVQHRKRAEVERTLTELASLGSREYFGEMSLFDEAAELGRRGGAGANAGAAGAARAPVYADRTAARIGHGFVPRVEPPPAPG